MLARGMQHAVVDKLHQAEQRDPNWHKSYGRALPGKLPRPQDRGGKNRRGGKRVRTQQNAEREQAQR